MTETSGTLTIQIPTEKMRIATLCLACNEVIDLGPSDSRYTCRLCDECKAAILWARDRIVAEHGRTDNGG